MRSLFKKINPSTALFGIALMTSALLITSCNSSSGDSGGAYSKTLNDVTVSLTRPSYLGTKQFTATDNSVTFGSVGTLLQITISDGTIDTDDIIATTGFTSSAAIDSNTAIYLSGTNSDGLATHIYYCNIGGTSKNASLQFASAETSSANANTIMNTVSFN